MASLGTEPEVFQRVAAIVQPAHMFRVRPSRSRVIPKSPQPIQTWNQVRYKWDQVTADVLRSTSELPLSGELKKAFEKRPASRKKRQHIRPQVVSPDLCDDLLKYAGHTLEQHKGCDILDLNPGACIWTQKLHEFLQPRRHVLLESDPEKYSSYQKPLVNAPNSKYQLIKGDPTDFKTYTRLVEDGAFPEQKRADPNDPTARKQNNSLLVTGSLIWYPKLPGRNFDSMAKQIYSHFAQAAPTFGLFHAFGPVRSLLWLEDDDFKSMLPQSMFQVAKGSIFLDLLGNTTRIVSSSQAARRAGRATVGREPQYQLRSISRGVEAGRERGMELPAHRRENIHDFADDIANLTKGARFATRKEVNEYLRGQENAGKSSIGLVPSTSIDIWHTEKKLSENPALFNAETPEFTPTMRIVPTLERKRFVINRAVTKSAERLLERVDDVVNKGEEAYHLECKILETEDSLEKDALLQKLKLVEQEFEALRSKINYTRQTTILTSLDDRISLASPIPRVQWDSRPFEPLPMRTEEAWPAMRLTLVSFEPRLPPANRQLDWFEWVQDFVHGLMGRPSMSVFEALELVQSGASQIIDNCPSLKDPKKGGRLNMRQLRVRMLTREMLDELAAAYQKWPFRDPGANHKKYFKFRP